MNDFDIYSRISQLMYARSSKGNRAGDKKRSQSLEEKIRLISDATIKREKRRKRNLDLQKKQGVA